jgi:hypothetical protein
VKGLTTCEEPKSPTIHILQRRRIITRTADYGKGNDKKEETEKESEQNSDDLL